MYQTHHIDPYGQMNRRGYDVDQFSRGIPSRHNLMHPPPVPDHGYVPPEQVRRDIWEEEQRRQQQERERQEREARERQQREEAERQAREAEQRRQQAERERQEREARERQQREEQERQRQAPSVTTPPINGAIDLSQPNGSKTEAKPTEQAKTPTATGANNTNVPAVVKKPRKPLIPEPSKEEKKSAPVVSLPAPSANAVAPAPPLAPVFVAPPVPAQPVIIEKKKDNYWWIIAAAVVGYIVLRKND